MSIHHSFDIDVACQHGIIGAVLLHHFAFWIRHNRDMNRNFHEERWWMYDTMDSIVAHFPYSTYAKIRASIDTLVAEGILLKGNFNKTRFDQTCWYAFADESMFLKITNGLSHSTIRSAPQHKPIPDTKPDIYVEEPKGPSTARTQPSAQSAAGLKQGKWDSEKLHFEESLREKWIAAYQEIDVPQEIAKAEAWLMANPSKANRTKNFARFVTNWLSSADERVRFGQKQLKALGKDAELDPRRTQSNEDWKLF